MKDFIIIGAGLSGLNTAKKIKDLALGRVLVLEKSRGVGGRMATRRAMETRFDHGAQFYRLNEDIGDLHHFWKTNRINQHWFSSTKGDHWCAKLGMTALAKATTDNLEIALEKEIQSIHFENNLWKLISKNNEEWFCQNLIVSSPLPQTIKLLEKINPKQLIDLNALSEIKQINYTKALVGLVTLHEDLQVDSSGYVEFQSEDFFSITDQSKKGVSEIPTLTLTMSPSFSDEEFDHTDDVILNKILKLFMDNCPNAIIKSAELKKWRYCQPTSRHKNLFVEIASNLYLIGDAFGGSSLRGAVRSSNALCNLLLDKMDKNVSTIEDNNEI